uniref:Uncharacterized protein n=1 Tax=Cajanus cajan TaxID=3821 RepID=A0A151SJD2_CAJCA|nr:hypothetical protein KK1_001110 [Cajanus cajan]
MCNSDAVSWRVVWMATTWNIWRHRNRCIFEGHQFSYENIITNIMFSCWRWLSTLKKDFKYSFLQWCSNPGPCLCSEKV